MTETLQIYLSKFSERDWLSALQQLLPEIHEVDRSAVDFWFRFYPLQLRRYLYSVGDLTEAKRLLQLQGDFDLAYQIDISHHFLYGHRYWPEVKESIEATAESFSDNSVDLADLIRNLSMQLSEKLKIDRSLIMGIVAVGLMTLNQVGLEKFQGAKGDVEKPTGLMARSPDQIVAERAKDDSQGLFGFVRTVDKRFSIHWLDKSSSGKFKIINDEEIASASARDRSQDWRARDPRCWEGVIPVECRSASCGTCWIGILGGKEKLSEVGHRERRMMNVFGYNQPMDEKPNLRLACQTKAYGSSTIVIPPWNGVFGKQVYGNVEELELEPVTTSAKKLRETIASATRESE